MFSLTTAAGDRLTLPDITSGAFRGESMRSAEPMADGETFAQLSADGSRIETYSFRTGKQSGTLFDCATARGAKLSRIDGYIVSPDGKNILLQTATSPIYRHSFTATYYIYNVANNKMVPLSDGGPQQTPLWSPDGTMVAFVRQNNVFLVKLLFDNAESQVTKDGEPGRIINGIPDWVCEEEFSHSRALVFTADSKRLVWVRYDESDVQQYPLLMFAGRSPKHTEYQAYPGIVSYKYPKAGEQNARVEVKSFDIKSRQTRAVSVPLDADSYVPRILATDDPERVAVYTLNRHQDCLRIYMANPMSTVCQLAVEDRVDKYINENVFADTRITANHLLLTSERTGFNSIYLYSLNGQAERTVTQGVVTQVYGYDETTGNLYFAALADGPLNQKIYVSRKNGKTDCLTPADGWHTAIFSSNFAYMLHTWSDINHPPVTRLTTTAGKVVSDIVTNKELETKLASYNLGRRELFSFTTGEGIVLNGWMVKPAGFDPTKKYPVVMYQYGGPGNQQVKNAWGIGMNGQGAILEQYLAQEGYVAVCVDNRGTGGRGADFEKCTYLRLGEKEAADQVETALWLKQQSWADGDRIAIWGWSYGGWNTLMAMSEGRPVFRCGIAIAPPTSWRYYDTVYTERFMRTPKENPEGYDEVNPIARAAKLSGELLICHGLADDNVHYQNTAEYTEALIAADKDYQQLVYTNRNHSIYGGNTRNHLFRQCINFFNKNLKH